MAVSAQIPQSSVWALASSFRADAATDYMFENRSSASAAFWFTEDDAVPTVDRQFAHTLSPGEAMNGQLSAGSRVWFISDAPITMSTEAAA